MQEYGNKDLELIPSVLKSELCQDNYSKTSILITSNNNSWGMNMSCVMQTCVVSLKEFYYPDHNFCQILTPSKPIVTSHEGHSVSRGTPIPVQVSCTMNVKDVKRDKKVQRHIFLAHNSYECTVLKINTNKNRFWAIYSVEAIKSSVGIY